MKPLALSMGEPGGIGPDITLLAWQYFSAKNGPVFALFTDVDALHMRMKELGFTFPVQVTTLEDAPRVFKTALPIIPLKNSVKTIAGKVDVENAAAVIEAITRAVEAVQSGVASAVVTNPIQKETLTKAGFSWPGQTEFLGELSFRHTKQKQRAVMMIASDFLKVVPLTIHMPLKDVPQGITAGLIIETAEILNNELQHKFKIEDPRITVAGLNPHAGENGIMGTEDETVIRPAIEELKKRGMNIRGPLPADTLFHETARRTYDAVIAMYHDQALIPAKTLAFDSAVNLTLGLPFVRTSPDHGTALNLAATGAAKPDSLIAAIELAARLAA
ncbi:MAG: 4-hydroxythreonine-4-phosphate dehydrogenase PdxA [Pseudomonadota bacterium]